MHQVNFDEFYDSIFTLLVTGIFVENGFDHDVKADTIESPVDCVCRNDVLAEMKTGKVWDLQKYFLC